MGSATKPWGEQWDYITRIQKSSWYGHWIVRNSYQQKKNKRVQWLESTAATEADLVIYYIHGKPITFCHWLFHKFSNCDYV